MLEINLNRVIFKCEAGNEIENKMLYSEQRTTLSDTNEEIEKDKIEWIVLEKDEENHRVLLLSKYLLDSYCYNESAENVSWENCDIRKWLNEDFYNAAFDEKEKEGRKCSKRGDAAYTFHRGARSRFPFPKHILDRTEGETPIPPKIQLVRQDRKVWLPPLGWLWLA